MGLESGLIHMVTGSGPVVQGVLIILILQSLWSWTVTIAKYFQFKRVEEQSEEFTDLFWENRSLARIDDSTKRLSASPLAQLFNAGFRELAHVDAEGVSMDTDRWKTVERALERAQLEQGERLEQGITFLATTASAAPFIGLFGTVWGIMNAFHGLGNSELTTIQAVAPGISEALVATAVGLAAAIPAAIAYNFYSVSVRRIRDSMASFQEDFLAVAARYGSARTSGGFAAAGAVE